MADTITKHESSTGKDHPASDYAYTPDAHHPSTWKLRLTNTPGGYPDPATVGAAAAALSSGGFRGQKADIPDNDLPGVKAKVRAAWKKANPDKAADDMPASIKGSEQADVEEADDADAADTAPEAVSPVPAGRSTAYLAKMVELARERLSAQEFQSMHAIARGHAGGTARGQSRKQPTAQTATEPASFADGYQPNPYHAEADETIVCPKCGKRNDDDAKYCDQCGFHLAGASGVKTISGQAASEAPPEQFMYPMPGWDDPDDGDDDNLDNEPDDRDYDDADDDDKATKASANFRKATSIGTQCGTCRLYRPDFQSCKVVEGFVEATDLCDLYAAVNSLAATPQAGSEPTAELIHLVASEATDDGPKRGGHALFLELPDADDDTRVPQWVPVLPKPGSYRHPRYGEINLTAERNQNFIRNFEQQVYQQHIPLDAEHQTKLSGAVGYYRQLRQNTDGSVDAAIDWTPRGKQLVASGQFKYMSPELYEEWQDPATGTTYRDVLIGGAITTRPFFKDQSLRPLVASERGLFAAGDLGAAADPAHPLLILEQYAEVPSHQRPAVGPGRKDRPMSGTTTTSPTPPKSEAREPSVAQAQAQAFAEVQAKLAASETVAQQYAEQIRHLEEQVGAMQQAERRQRFTELARDFIGETAPKITLMEHLADTAGEESALFSAYLSEQRAQVEQARQARLFSVVGSGAARQTSGPLDAITQAVTAKRASEPGLSEADAQRLVFSERPDLYRQYRAESFKRDLNEEEAN